MLENRNKLEVLHIQSIPGLISCLDEDMLVGAQPDDVFQAFVLVGLHTPAHVATCAGNDMHVDETKSGQRALSTIYVH